MYVCTYVCMYVCMYMYILLALVCVCVFVCVCVCVCVCVYCSKSGSCLQSLPCVYIPYFCSVSCIYVYFIQQC